MGAQTTLVLQGSVVKSDIKPVRGYEVGDVNPKADLAYPSLSTRNIIGDVERDGMPRPNI